MGSIHQLGLYLTVVYLETSVIQFKLFDILEEDSSLSNSTTSLDVSCVEELFVTIKLISSEIASKHIKEAADDKVVNNSPHKRSKYHMQTINVTL
jgi:hypothetical protein